MQEARFIDLLLWVGRMPMAQYGLRCLGPYLDTLVSSTNHPTQWVAEAVACSHRRISARTLCSEFGHAHASFGSSCAFHSPSI